MANNAIQMPVVLAANRNEDSKVYGKYFGQPFAVETLSMRGLIDHMISHGLSFPRYIIKGVVDALVQCIPELVAQGNSIKLDGLGRFYPTIENTKGGANSVQDWDVQQNVKGVHFRFEPDSTKLDNMTSTEFKNKVELVKAYVKIPDGSITRGSGASAKTETVWKIMKIDDYLKMVDPNYVAPTASAGNGD